MTEEAGPPSGGGQVLQPLELLGALQKHEVGFVVIGGFSLAAHGFVRGTKDIDVVPDPDMENLERLARALKYLGAEVMGMEDFDKRELSVALDADGLGQGGNWVLATRFGRLDIMQSVAGSPRYSELESAAVALDLPGLSHPTMAAGIDDLIAMKTAAGRPQDRLDLAELERIRDSGH